MGDCNSVVLDFNSNNADPREGIKTLAMSDVRVLPQTHSNNADPREGIKTHMLTRKHRHRINDIQITLILVRGLKRNTSVLC